MHPTTFMAVREPDTSNEALNGFVLGTIDRPIVVKMAVVGVDHGMIVVLEFTNHTRRRCSNRLRWQWTLYSATCRCRGHGRVRVILLDPRE
jgi:hypothetical protein